MTTISTPLPLPGNDSCEPQLAALIQESQNHPAVRHPFLKRFAEGTFLDNQHALRTYAIEYSGYAAAFPHYLTAVISRLSNPAHQELLAHNLEEEKGHIGEDDCEELRRFGINPDSVQGVPHPVLFRRFCAALGIDAEQLARPRAAALQWRNRFLEYLQNATAAEAVGALGLGTEQVVRPIYEQLLQGIIGMGTLRRDQFVFFELHCLVDDQHQQDLLDIASELAAAPDGLDGLRRGMLTALRMRREFWDHLYRTVLNTQLANPA